MIFSDIVLLIDLESTILAANCTNVQLELELELILSRWLWERGEKGGASLQKQARVRALCGVMQ